MVSNVFLRTDILSSMLNEIENTLQKLATSQFFCIALSGGVDSMALLYAMFLLRQKNPDWQLRAIHVNHGLNKMADQWQVFCKTICTKLNIPFIAESVVIRDNGDGIEAEAREKRYAVFEKQLKPNENLLTGQHQDDQAETFLLQLMRGAGIKGLSAMGQKRKLGKGYLLRPLLSCSRDEIIAYAKHHQLDWIEDDSNLSLRFARNYVRHQVAPVLRQRWPHFAESIVRSAQHCANAQNLLEEYLAEDYQNLINDNGELDWQQLIMFSPNRQWVLLRYWIVQQGFRLPSAKQLSELYRAVVEAAPDANPEFRFGDTVVTRYRHQLTIQLLQPEKPLLDAEQLYKKLCQQGLRSDIKQDELEIRYYQGGEKIRLPGRTFRHKLKNCWQDWGVAPWQRTRIPLVYYNDELIAVLDYAIADGFAGSLSGSDPDNDK